MKPVKPRSGWRIATGLIFDALSGRLGVSLMALAYASFAVVLLAYVSTQVYTSSLNEQISRRRSLERSVEEQMGLLTAEYTRLASRARIAPFCEDKLGMVEADKESMHRLRINGDDNDDPFLRSLDADGPVALPGWTATEINGITEAKKR